MRQSPYNEPRGPRDRQRGAAARRHGLALIAVVVVVIVVIIVAVLASRHQSSSGSSTSTTVTNESTTSPGETSTSLAETSTSVSETSTTLTKTPVAKPTVTRVSPSSGSTAGGNVVTISGTGFTKATSVRFGTVTTTHFTVKSSTKITVTVPAQKAGTHDVNVTTPSGRSASNSTDKYTYK